MKCKWEIPDQTRQAKTRGFEELPWDHLITKQHFLEKRLPDPFYDKNPGSSWAPVVAFRLLLRLVRQLVAILVIGPFCFILYIPLSVWFARIGIRAFKKFYGLGSTKAGLVSAAIAVLLFIFSISIFLSVVYWLSVFGRYVIEKLRAAKHIVSAATIHLTADIGSLPRKTLLGEGDVLVSVLCDIHLSTQGETIEGNLNCSDVFFDFLQDYAPLVQEADCTLLLGDLVDTGAAEEWQLFQKAVRYGGLKNRCIIVPGNHDINIARDMGRTPEPYRRVFREFRIGLFLNATRNLLHPECMMMEGKGRNCKSIRAIEYLCGKWEALSDFLGNVTIKNYSEAKKITYLGLPIYTEEVEWSKPSGSILPSSILKELYPLQLRIGHYLIIALNSCCRSPSSLATNAIGAISRKQFKRLRYILSDPNNMNLTKIIALHHAPIVGKKEPRNANIFLKTQSQSFRWLYLQSSAKLLRICRIFGAKSIIHGHFHRASYIKYRDVRVFSCRGPTLREEDAVGPVLSGPTFLTLSGDGSSRIAEFTYEPGSHNA